MRRLLVFMFVCVGGCMPETHEPECWMQQEAELLTLAYEDKYDVTLEDRVFNCMQDFEVGWVDTSEELGNICYGLLPIHAEAGGCHFSQKRREGVILFSREVWDTVDFITQQHILRHELTHHLLLCLGTPQTSHRELFGYDSGVWNPDSLGVYADSITPEDLYYECL